MNIILLLRKKGLPQLCILIAICQIAVAQQPQNDKLFEISKNLEIFSEIYTELNNSYVDELDPSEVMRIGIDAMMHSLDPYTVYYSESQIERYQYLVEGKYDGIGASVEFIDDYVTLTQLYKGYAADRAGLRPGDQIIKLNGRSTKGKTTNELSYLMKGDNQKEIKLTIYRPTTDNTFDISIKRDDIETPNVPYYGMVAPNIGYVALSTFTENAGANVRKAISKIKEENPQIAGIILDLRNNGGGLLSEAVNLTNVFIPKNKLVVSTKSKVRDEDKVYMTLGTPLDLEVRLVVLVNNRSASASEIVSGTLQDYDRAVIVGQRTYGKGLVQNTKKLSFNSQMKLTTARYYIPSGRCIQALHYENGEPIHIPDSLRSEFKTNNGRIVLDGGGVSPDIHIDKMNTPPVIQALQDKNIIFKYVNYYQEKHPTIPEIGTFSYDNYKDFLAFVHNKNFSFTTKSEEKLKALKEKLKQESYFKDVADNFNDIEKEMLDAKEESLQTYKKDIIKIIEEEIAARYYYQKGRIQQKLQNDDEVETAIQLLQNKKKYEALLVS